MVHDSPVVHRRHRESFRSVDAKVLDHLHARPNLDKVLSTRGFGYSQNAKLFEEQDEEDKDGIYHKLYSSELGDETVFFEKVHVRQAIDFFSEPSSSYQSFIYHLCLTSLVIARIIFICLESTDGPNQYEGRRNQAKFPWLFDSYTYFLIEICCLGPMILDNIIKCTILLVIYGLDRNRRITLYFTQDRLKIVMIFLDCISCFPFIVKIITNDDFYNYPKLPLIFMRTCEMLSISRVLRITRDIKAIYATRMALERAVPHLILPIFFFLVINVTAAVILYFIEPCYDKDSCPWKDMFDATFFSVVSMSTVGYGNQIPLYEVARGVTILLILCGVLFICMPLALIGNEFERISLTTSIQKLTYLQRLRITWRRSQVRPDDELELMSMDKNGRDAMEKAYDKHPLVLSWRSLNQAATDLLMDVTVVNVNDGNVVYSNIVKCVELKCGILPILQRVDEFQSKFTSILTLVTPSGVDETSEGTALEPLFNNSSQLLRRISSFVGVTIPTKKESNRLREAQGIESSQKSSKSAKTAKTLEKELSIKVNLDPNIKIETAEELATLVEEAESEAARKAEGIEIGTEMITPTKNEVGTNKIAPDPSSSSSSSGENDGKNNKNVSEEIDLDKLMATPTKDDEHTYSDTRESESTNIDSPDQNVTRPEPSNEKRGPGSLRESLRKSNSLKQKLEVRKAKRAERQKSVDDTARKKAVRNTIVSVRPRIPGLNKRVRLSGMNEDRLKFVMENSTHWQCRLFLTMEYPKYSFWSRCIQMILIMFICLSVFLLFSETLTSFHNYSESTELCGKVLQIYCNSKYDPLKDPGCFVHEWDPSINQIRPTLNKLKYDCDSDDCFANGYNFGSGGNVTCGVHSTLYDETNPVFQDEADLRRTYGYPTFITSRYEFQRIMPVCQRVECSEEVSLVRDANLFWLIGEFTVNIIFSIEFILRLLGSVGSARYFFMDYLNWFDISALLPFYIEVIGGLTAGKTLYQLDFTIISSAPLPIILIAARSFKVLRLFKLLRHFTASKVLVDTARLGWKPMAAILMMLVFFTIVFAVIFFELERGTACYVGDDDCEVPELVYYSDGQRIVLDKYGDESKISNVFYGVWFSFITLTSTGYGDIVPVTNIGQGFCVILIILGAMYMSMPLTVAASTFSHVHEQYERLHGRINEEELQNKRLAQKHLQFTIKLGVKKSLMSLYEKTNDFLELIELKQKYKDRELDEQLNLALIDVLEDAKHTVPTVEDSLEHYIRAELAIARLEKSVNVVG